MALAVTGNNGNGRNDNGSNGNSNYDNGCLGNRKNANGNYGNGNRHKCNVKRQQWTNNGPTMSSAFSPSTPLFKLAYLSYFAPTPPNLAFGHEWVVI